MANMDMQGKPGARLTQYLWCKGRR